MSMVFGMEGESRPDRIYTGVGSPVYAHLGDT
jgi:hypothetical protein